MDFLEELDQLYQQNRDNFMTYADILKIGCSI